MAGVLLAYLSGLRAPFVFDDVPNLLENPALRASTTATDWRTVAGDPGATLSGRPLILASFLLNKALTGVSAPGFRAGNLVIHIAGALLLFGLCRRLLGLPALRRYFPGGETVPAFLIAALWALHPLQTSAVTYVVQRAESLTALCYLGTLYAFVRALTDTPKPGWLIGSVMFCAAGMTGKETMVTAPLAVLLLDASLFSGAVGTALRRRGPYYLALAATWVILAMLVVGTGGRGGTAGFDSTVTVWSYLLTQCGALVGYAALVVWPHPLVFDYGTATVGSLSEVWWQALLVLSALTAAAWLWFRRSHAALPLVWFFLVLAPTSSFVPIASQTVAEHRLYLAMLGPLTLLVALVWRWLGTKALPALLTVAVIFGILTSLRNHNYRSELTLWRDTVQKRFENPRARINLARAELAAGNPEEARDQLQMALRLDPVSADAHYNLGVVYARLAQPTAAEAAYREAVRFRPAYAEAWNNLGTIRLYDGKPEEAMDMFQRALEIRPRYAEAQANLALALLESGRTDEALAAARTARAFDPRSATAAFALGNASIAARQWSEAHAAYSAAVALRPDYAEAHNNLANVLLEADRVNEALAHYEAAARADPGYAEPRRALTAICAQTGRYADALRYGEELLRLQPGDESLRQELVRLRAYVR